MKSDDRESAFDVLRDAGRLAGARRRRARRPSWRRPIMLGGAILIVASAPFVLLDDLAPAASPGAIVGTASVIDGDTIEIHGTRIRLEGIDAPESRQLCQDASGSNYRCGQRAALYLSDMIAGRRVTCEPTGQDRYGRTLAHCSVAGQDINGEMVAAGWALAYRRYSTRYVADERRAQAAGAGMWQGAFEAPWDWRKTNR